MRTLVTTVILSVITMLIASTSFASIHTIYEYDANGNLIKRANMNATEMAYIPTEKKSFTGKERVFVNAKGVNFNENARTTVQFWMYWNGHDNMMPFSWHSGYTLYLSGNILGFNSANGDLYGFPAEQLANKWVQITAVFHNGDISKGEIYVNGILQPLKQYGNEPLYKHVSENATVSGWSYSEHYRFKGQLANLKIWSRALSQTEITSSVYSDKPVALEHLVGCWELKDDPSHSLKFKGLQKLELSGIKANLSTSSQTTVQFWMKWSGKANEMPFSWGSYYTLYFNADKFGFNTGNGDVYGIPSQSLIDKWVHVTAIFTNEDTNRNELFINGVKQTLIKEGISLQRNVADKANISGWIYDDFYKYNGEITGLKIWNKALNEIEIQSEMYKTTETENGDLIYSMF